VHEGGATLLHVSQPGPGSPLLFAELCLLGATGLVVVTQGEREVAINDARVKSEMSPREVMALMKDGAGESAILAMVDD
jgi:hypothetical protein